MLNHLRISENLKMKKLVRPERFELPTTWFEAKYSMARWTDADPTMQLHALTTAAILVRETGSALRDFGARLSARPMRKMSPRNAHRIQLQKTRLLS
jgi:hypothetical protein